MPDAGNIPHFLPCNQPRTDARECVYPRKREKCFFWFEAQEIQFKKKKIRRKILPSSPLSDACTNTNISPINTLQKDNWYKRIPACFPIDIYSAPSLTNPWKKLQLFRQDWFYYFKYFQGIKIFLIDWIYMLKNHFKTAMWRIKKNY